MSEKVLDVVDFYFSLYGVRYRWSVWGAEIDKLTTSAAFGYIHVDVKDYSKESMLKLLDEFYRKKVRIILEGCEGEFVISQESECTGWQSIGMHPDQQNIFSYTYKVTLFPITAEDKNTVLLDTRVARKRSVGELNAKNTEGNN